MKYLERSLTIIFILLCSYYLYSIKYKIEFQPTTYITNRVAYDNKIYLGTYVHQFKKNHWAIKYVKSPYLDYQLYTPLYREYIKNMYFSEFYDYQFELNDTTVQKNDLLYPVVDSSGILVNNKIRFYYEY